MLLGRLQRIVAFPGTIQEACASTIRIIPDGVIILPERQVLPVPMSTTRDARQKRSNVYIPIQKDVFQERCLNPVKEQIWATSRLLLFQMDPLRQMQRQM